jgi:leucyl-tRNA synthetase
VFVNVAAERDEAGDIEDLRGDGTFVGPVAAEIEALVRKRETVTRAIGDKPIRKIIVVPGRIVNVVA